MRQALALRRKWAARIRHSFAKAVEAILEVGSYLAAAKRELPHGEFERMIEEDLGWHASTARRLMAIARHPVLGDRAHVHVLPPSWGTLYELTKFPVPVLTRAIHEGRITPELSRTALPTLAASARLSRGAAAEREGACSNLEELTSDDVRFGTIYADPPWAYDDRSNRGAAPWHYATLTTAEIARLPVASLAAPNAHLHLWTTTAFLFESRTVLEAWGFKYKSILVWIKPRLGIGHYWRMAHEFLLLGVRGECHFSSGRHRSWFEAPREEHSRKPELVRQMIEEVSPGPRLELFGRTSIPGWTVWGNDVVSSRRRRASRRIARGEARRR